MDLLVQLDAAVLSRILSSLPQRQALALTILAQDWLRLVAAHLWRLVVSPDLSPGLAQTAATHCVRLREVVFQSSQAAQASTEQEARAFWLHAAGIWRSLLTTPVAPLRQLTLRGSGEADGKSAGPFLAELPKSAGNCRCLRDFHVENIIDADDGIITFLLEFLPPLPLQSLRLRNCNLKGSEIIDLCRALHMAPMLNSLSDLDLSQNAMSEEGAGALAHLLPGVSELRSLALSGNGLGPVGLAALANALPPSLKHLDLSLNGLGTVGLAVLQQANLRLDSLNLRGNWFGASDTEVLPSLLRSMSDSISRLDVGQNKLGPAGVKDFLDQLPPLPKLNMLSLAENQFATADFSPSSFRQLATSAPGLEELNLNANLLGSDQAMLCFVCAALPSTLRVLHLGASSLDGSNLGVMLPILNLPCLECLSFVQARLDDRGTAMLAEWLQKKPLPKLQQLDISGNRIAREAIAQLQNSLHTITGFKQLKVGGCRQSADRRG